MPESKGQVITTEPIGMDSEKRYYWHFGGMLDISCLPYDEISNLLYITRFTMAMEGKGKVKDWMSMGNR